MPPDYQACSLTGSVVHSRRTYQPSPAYFFCVHCRESPWGRHSFHVAIFQTILRSLKQSGVVCVPRLVEADAFRARQV